jgi:hypothetical protein
MLHSLSLFGNFSTVLSAIPHITRSTQLYLQHLVFFFFYYFVPLLWKKFKLFEYAVCGVHQPQHNQTSSNSSTIAVVSRKFAPITDAVDTVVCAPDGGWKYHTKYVEQYPDMNKMCTVSSCWIYIGILLRAQTIHHVSRIWITVYGRGFYLTKCDIYCYIS